MSRRMDRGRCGDDLLAVPAGHLPAVDRTELHGLWREHDHAVCCLSLGGGLRVQRGTCSSPFGNDWRHYLRAMYRGDLQGERREHGLHHCHTMRCGPDGKRGLDPCGGRELPVVPRVA